MATVSEVRVRAGRRSELALMSASWAIIVLARALVDYHADFLELQALGVYAAGAGALMLAGHLVLRRFAPSADPVLLPAVFAINGVGLAMIRRVDFAYAQYKGRETAFGDSTLR